MRVSLPRSAVIALCVCVVMGGVGAASQVAAWSFDRPMLGGVSEPVANVTQTLAGPAWLMALRLTNFSIRADPLWIIGVNVAAWVGWFAVLLACGWFWRFVGWSRSRENGGSHPVSPGRRALLARGAMLTAGACTGGVVFKATFADPFGLRVTRIRARLRGLDAALDGLRVVQITDTHLGPRVPSWYVRAAVREAIACAPDVFVLTGDYIHDGADRIDEVASLFAPLAETGASVFGVLGNHDWYGDGEAVARAMRAVGVTMVDNSRCWYRRGVGVVDSYSAGDLRVAGVGDLMCDTVDVEAALPLDDPEAATLLLSHNPDVAEMGAFAGRGVDLMLSGHTHGGQVRLPFVGAPGVPSRYGQRYASGMCAGPLFPVYVSTGVGMSIAPIRFGVAPEVAAITLVAKG